MPGLRLILTDWQGERAAAAIEAAAATAALGHPVSVLLRGPALALPAESIAMLHDLGVRITACQTAMAAAGVPATALPPGVEPGGMIAFLANAQGAQLLLA